MRCQVTDVCGRRSFLNCINHRDICMSDVQTTVLYPESILVLGCIGER